MDMMPVIPMAFESLPTPVIPGTSANTGTVVDFESWMAEFAGFQKCADLQKTVFAAFPGLKAIGSANPLIGQDGDLIFSGDDVDALMSGDESIYAAFLASFSQGEIMDFSPEDASEVKVSQDGFAVVPENPAGASLISDEQDEAALLSGQTQIKKPHSGAVLAEKMTENPAVLTAAADNEDLNEKNLKNSLIATSPAKVEKEADKENEASQKIIDPLVEKIVAKETLRETATEKGQHQKGTEQGQHQKGTEQGNISISSNVSEDKFRISDEGLQSPSIASSSETGLADTAKSGSNQPIAQTETSLPEVNVTGLSSSPGSSGGTEAVGKDFVNVREGVEFFRLPSGEMVDKSSVLDQVISHVSLRQAREGKTLTVRLHPQELGDLKLDLILENDKVRVNIQTQTNMVQDVLEQHLPRLREALEAQGVRVGEMQLSLDSQQQNGFESFRNFSTGQDSLQQQSSRAFQLGNDNENGVTESSPEELAGTGRNAAGSGLSLRI